MQYRPLPFSEAEWQQCDNPIQMLQRLGSRALWRRKLRLLACGFCRRIWHCLPPGAHRQAIEAAEQYADGEITRAKLAKLQKALEPGFLPFSQPTRDMAHRAITQAMRTYPEETPERMMYIALSTAWEIGELAPAPRAVWEAREPQWDTYVGVRNSATYRTEQSLRAHLIRDVFPAPDRKVEFDPAWLHWRNDTITHLARTIYEEHHLEDLVILADALEEAGCVEAGIIEHCRQPGPHIRGCWVVDLLLEK